MSRDPRDPIVAPQHWIEAGPGRWVSTRGLPATQQQQIEAALKALARVRSTSDLRAVTETKKSA